VSSSGTGTGRRETPTRRLLRAGFADLTRSAQLWDDAALGAVLPADDGAVVQALGRSADPDLALLQLVRLAGVPAAAEPLAELLARAGSDDVAVRRLFAVLGASGALGDEIIRRPGLLGLLGDDGGLGVEPDAVRAELLRAVGADPESSLPVAAEPPADPDATPAWPDAGARTATDALRRAYRARLLRIAATDLTADDPQVVLPGVGAALADLAAGALDAALAVARAEVADHGAGVRLAVIGMGKTGGRELNYISDVDVVYVCEPQVVDGAPVMDEPSAMRAGSQLASRLQKVCGGTSVEPALWEVDAALRPEGKQGPLVRTLESHLTYYERWASTWEFQALLKARHVAGDAQLGAAYQEATAPFVWAAVNRDNFVEDAQAMRRRVENHVPAAEADRQIKLGKGGLRDVEFTVQLLQLVHGRTDDTIHEANTLDALASLAREGFVGREHAVRMGECYRFLRSLEHRVQLFRLRRTHLLPTGEDELRRLARSLGVRDGADGLMKRWRETRREVRALHEAVFYRPLLPAWAQLSDDEISLAPEAARARFAAIGYRDPDGAMRHVVALTEGTSRRAALQRQLLPVMLGWFAEGADPDGGLLSFRKLSEDLGSTPWYLRLLRDSGNAAYHLAHLLASSRYLSEALARSPESVRWLADTSQLDPRGPERLAAETDAILTRADEPGPAATKLRGLRRRELARTGAGEALGVLDPVRAQAAISDAADVALVGGLRVAEHAARIELGLGPDREANPTRMVVVAMGRLGGREMGYGSDADVMFAHQPVEGADERLAQDFALATARKMQKLLSAVGPEPALPVDADLRPEGRQGPLVRTFDSYAEYYERWASVWEQQALLRARPVAGAIGGESDLDERFRAMVDPLRYPAGGLAEPALREVRRIKARVESERLPRGADPLRHLKLGRGGVSDVEWAAQLLQLQHAHEIDGLRTTGTVAALDAAERAGLLDPQDARCLREGWVLASRLRSALVLWSGKVGGPRADVLPSDARSLSALASLLGDVGSGGDLEELYLRTSRRARSVMERVVYGEN
jgi:glutamate-ammonia-ligase adenylyltransferase